MFDCCIGMSFWGLPVFGRIQNVSLKKNTRKRKQDTHSTTHIRVLPPSSVAWHLQMFCYKCICLWCVWGTIYLRNLAAVHCSKVIIQSQILGDLEEESVILIKYVMFAHTTPHCCWISCLIELRFCAFVIEMTKGNPVLFSLTFLEIWEWTSIPIFILINGRGVELQTHFDVISCFHVTLLVQSSEK